MPWKEKAWQWAGVVSDDAFVACAVAHLGYLGFCFAYAVDRRTGKTASFQATTPLAAGTQVAAGPEDGHSAFHHPSGYVLIDNRPRRMVITLQAFQAEAEFQDIVPWDATWSIEGTGYNRTQKAMGLPATGTLHLGDEDLSLSGHGLLDYTRGCPAHETSWRWAAGTGHSGGRIISWNLRTGFDDPTGAENAVWIDGEPRGLGPAQIVPPTPEEVAKEPHERSPLVWRIACDGLELAFTEAGDRHENLDLTLIASRYRQPWGSYRGTFEGAPLEGYGVTEDHWARW